ncbi:cAMP-dependent protein kinase catalytic subunit PRKX-like isoform X3 [Varroa destructor]|uniref:Protein kinase domain-containing protein n=1 Tax=Varroa destructor TaxID=109461 RepID=A0A7M7J0A9_VARDE|nr:cAMP-dependent protein kinase catalytic subunit PRKX-like isoform X3 [Varroa destructor]
MACCRAVPTAKNCHFPAEKREMMARRTAYSNSPSCSCSSSSSSSGDNDGARGGSQDVTFTLAVCQNSTSPIGQDGNQMPIPPLNDGVSYSFRFSDLNVIKTIGTGTFGRVCLCRADDNYYALKIMRIDDVIRLKQVDHVRNEKAILQQIEHPFIIKLLWTHHSQQALYMLLEFVAGGELFTYLRNAGKFSNSAAVFYASEIVLALEYLHSKNIVYRDLKPENLLLDKSGHLKVTDFGFAKQLSDRTWTLCGTPEYLAPEIIQSKAVAGNHTASTQYFPVFHAARSFTTRCADDLASRLAIPLAAPFVVTVPQRSWSPYAPFHHLLQVSTVTTRLSIGGL